MFRKASVSTSAVVFLFDRRVSPRLETDYEVRSTGASI